MKFALLLLLVSTSVSAGFAGFAGEVGANQINIARRRVMQAREMTENAVYTCLVQIKDCQVDQTELATLANINKIAAKSDVQFKSARENKGLFDVASGTHRIAVTGETADATIFINSDEIDSQGANLSLMTIVSIFTHELGHHTGLKDTDEHFLDQLGNKVSRMFKQNLLSLRGEAEVLVYNQIASPSNITDWNRRDVGTLPLIYFSDGVRILSLDASFPLLLNCPFGSEVRHAWLTDLHWKDHATLAGREVHYCLMSKNKMEVSSSYFASFELAVKDGRPQFTGTPAQQVIPISLFELTSDHSYENLFEMKGPTVVLDVVSGKSSPAKLDGGGKWSISFDVKGDPKLYRECTLLISSDEFSLAYPTGQKFALESDPKDCKFSALGGGKMRVEGSFTFRKDVVSRNYFLKGIKLQPKDLMKGSPGAIFPDARQTVHVGTAPAVAGEFGAISTTAQGKTVEKPSYGMGTYKLCNKFQLSFELPTNAPLSQAHLKYTLNYKGNQLSPITLTERITYSFWHTFWKYSSEPLSSGKGQRYTFTLSLMPEFMEVEQINRVDFREITVMTEAMEEYKVTFSENQFGFAAGFFPGAGCDQFQQ